MWGQASGMPDADQAMGVIMGPALKGTGRLGPARGMPDEDRVIRRKSVTPAPERGSGSAKRLPSGAESGLCPAQRARVSHLWGPARGMLDADQAILQNERRLPAAARARGVRSSSPPGCARSSEQGSHSCRDLPAACRMQIGLSGSKSAARLRWSGLGECEAPPLQTVPGAAGKCRMQIRLSCSKSAARLRRSRLGECEAAPLRAVPGAVGKGPTLVGTGPLHAGCGSSYPEAIVPLAHGGAGSGSAKRALPGAAGKGPTLVGTGPLHAGCRSGPSSGYLAASVLPSCRGAALGSAKQLPSGPCPGQRVRVLLLRGPACSMPDVDQAIWQQERRSPAAKLARGVRSSSPPGCAWISKQVSHACGDWPAACRMRIRLSSTKSTTRLRQSRLGECEAAPLRAVPGAVGKGPTLVGSGPPQHA